jgi:hypothetical protein
MKLIGDDRREAIDWLQDRLQLTRPVAEQAMISLMREKSAITTDEGIFLTEDEDETDVKAKKFSQRMHNRKTSRKSRVVHKLQKQVNNKKDSGKTIAKTDFSDVADGIMDQDDDNDAVS